MPPSKRAPRTSGKKRAPSKKRKTSRSFPKLPVFRILLYVVLLLFFILSTATLFYVIFFQVVVASELPEHERVPKAAIIIDDMGNNLQIGRALLALDLNLTYSFLPHSPFCEKLLSAASQTGRTVMLHVPLEPLDPEKDPGAGAIHVGDSRTRMAELFAGHMAAVPYAVGVNNHMGSRFTEDQRAMDGLAKIIGEHHLFFIDSLTSNNSKAMTAVGARGIPAAERDIFIDNQRTVGAVCSRIKELTEIAVRKGTAIGIGHPYPETLQALSRCAPDLQSIELVNAEQLVYERRNKME